jgi:hypothetical protein
MRGLPPTRRGLGIGENCEVRLGAKERRKNADNPHGGLAYMNQLLGRVVRGENGRRVLDLQSFRTTAGRRTLFLLVGDCLGNAIAEPET